MTLNQIFSPSRFLNLLREETASGYKMPIIVASVVFVILSIIFIINASDHDNGGFHEIWYGIILLAGGFYFTSSSFNELNKKEERMNYLALPASIFEKFSLKLLVTSLGYLIGLTLIYWIFAQVIDSVTQSYFEWSFRPFDIRTGSFPLLIKLYLVLQSLFILGAATFNRFAFFKTLFAIGILGIGIGIFTGLCFRGIFAEYFQSFFEPKENVGIIPSIAFRDFMQYTAWPLLQNIFWYVLAPVMWIVAYFKLKEREV